MTKSELVDLLLEQNPHLYRRDIENVVGTMLKEISDGIVSGARVELRGFGVFFTKERKARVGRNPKTGEAVQVEAKAVPRFKTSPLLLKRLNAIKARKTNLNTAKNSVSA